MRELTEMDMKTKWSLNRAATFIFGHTRDHSYISIRKEGNTKRPAGPSKAIELNRLTEREINDMFIEASGGRKIIKRALGKQTPGRQISFDTLYDYWKETMKSKWGVKQNPQNFLQEMQYYKLFGDKIKREMREYNNSQGSK